MLRLGQYSGSLLVRGISTAGRLAPRALAHRGPPKFLPAASSRNEIIFGGSNELAWENRVALRPFATAPRPPQPPPPQGDWEEVVSDDNKIYYWNRTTNATQWDVPPGMEREEWRQLHDDSGRAYWWNTYSGATQWEDPFAPGGMTDYSPRDKVLIGADSHSPEVTRLVNTEALVVQRIIEWANVIVGFEQANKYEIKNATGQIVGYIAEEQSGIIDIIKRQILRTHRPWKVTVFDSHFNPLFILDRPFYIINSSMNVLSAEGDLIGEVLQRWHPWQRNYDLYFRKEQFASINGGFLTWDFILEDEEKVPIGHISKQMLGFMREIMTDGNQYVLYMENMEHLGAGAGAAATEGHSSQELKRAEMSVDERLVALGAAVAIDFDYFSRSGGHGGIPLPFFFPGGSSDYDSASSGGAGAAGAAAAEAGDFTDVDEDWNSPDEDDSFADDDGYDS